MLRGRRAGHGRRGRGHSACSDRRYGERGDRTEAGDTAGFGGGRSEADPPPDRDEAVSVPLSLAPVPVASGPDGQGGDHTTDAPAGPRSAPARIHRGAP